MECCARRHCVAQHAPADGSFGDACALPPQRSRLDPVPQNAKRLRDAISRSISVAVRDLVEVFGTAMRASTVRLVGADVELTCACGFTLRQVVRAAIAGRVSAVSGALVMRSASGSAPSQREDAYARPRGFEDRRATGNRNTDPPAPCETRDRAFICWRPVVPTAWPLGLRKSSRSSFALAESPRSKVNVHRRSRRFPPRCRSGPTLWDSGSTTLGQ